MSCMELWARADADTWMMGSWLIGTLGAAGATLGYRIRGRQAHSWPIVEARVESAHVGVMWYHYGRYYTPRFDVEVTYSYVVEGVTYTSKRFQVGGGKLQFRSKASAAGQARAYQAGRRIGALYCPGNPAYSVLRPGSPVQHLYVLGFLLFMNVAFLWAYC